MMRSESTLCSCVYTYSSYFLSTLNPSTPVLPAVHLSSRTSPSDDSPHSVPPLLSLRNVIFHFSWVYMVLSCPPFPSFVVAPLPLCPVTSSSSSSRPPLTIISPDKNLLKLQMCRGKKNKMGRALIPGISDSPFWPWQNEPRSVWFGQCYSCLSKWPQVPGRFEEKSTQTRAGTGLNLTTIFESFLPSKSFWFKHTHHMHRVCLH